MTFSKEKRDRYYRDRYNDNVKIVRDYKLEKGCADCGWKEHHAGLEFDHLQSRKKGTVANQMGKSLKVIMEEISLCEVVCSRCHSIRTWNRLTDK